MKNSKIDRLEDALLDFVERVSRETTCEAEVQVLPQVAQALIEIAKLP